MILALDQSTTALGWCQHDGKKIVSAGSQRFPRKETARAEDRVPLVTEFCSRIFGQLPEGSIVVLERTIIVRRGRATVATLETLSELRGRLIGLAESAGHRVRLVHPREWRAWFGIRIGTPREAAKAMALQIASRLMPIVGKDDDMAEAICMAEWMRGVLQAEEVERRARRSA